MGALDMKGLSWREQQVADLLSQGLRSKEIAARLDICFSTVCTYVQRLKKKVDAPRNENMKAKLYADRIIGQVFNANEGTGNRPIWLPVPEGFQLNQPVYDVVRRVE
jgi:DNA-binding CsgD family transcriptional regulator